MMTYITQQTLTRPDGSQRPIDLSITHSGDIEHDCYINVRSGSVSMSIGPVTGSDLAGALTALAKEIGEALDSSASPWRRDKWIKADDK